jgi:hypothetical protein
MKLHKNGNLSVGENWPNLVTLPSDRRPPFSFQFFDKTFQGCLGGSGMGYKKKKTSAGKP